MDFGKKKKVIKKKKARTRSSFIPLGVSSIRLLDFPKTETKGYFKNIDNRPLLVYALLSLTGRWLRWHFYLTILLGYTLDLSGGAGWVTMMMDVNCSKGEDVPSTAQTNKQTNKQINNPFVYFFPCGLIVSILLSSSHQSPPPCEQFPPVSIIRKFLRIFAIVDDGERNCCCYCAHLVWLVLYLVLLDVQCSEHISCKACALIIMSFASVICISKCALLSLLV